MLSSCLKQSKCPENDSQGEKREQKTVNKESQAIVQRRRGSRRCFLGEGVFLEMPPLSFVHIILSSQKQPEVEGACLQVRGELTASQRSGRESVQLSWRR